MISSIKDNKNERFHLNMYIKIVLIVPSNETELNSKSNQLGCSKSIVLIFIIESNPIEEAT